MFCKMIVSFIQLIVLFVCLLFLYLLLLEINTLIDKKTCKEVRKYLQSIGSKLSKYVDVNDYGEIN